MRSYLTQVFDAVNLAAGGKSSKKMGPIRMPASVTHNVCTERWRCGDTAMMHIYVLIYQIAITVLCTRLIIIWSSVRRTLHVVVYLYIFLTNIILLGC